MSRARHFDPLRRAAGGARRARAAVAQKAGARIREQRLDNGLRVLLVERHGDPVVASILWYRVGSRDEREHEAGVSHFLEHMMFKGSRSYAKGEVDLVTTLLGGSNNAFTTPDHTAYWFELASDRWDKALDIEADRMRGLLLDPAEFEAEKAVVLEELAMGLDDPWRGLAEEVQGLIFGRHPYRRPIIGYADTLAALTVDEMRAYYRRFYHPANAVLVVAGDIEPNTALEAIGARFGALPGAESAVEPERPRAPLAAARGERRVVTRWDDESRRLCMAWPTVAVGTRADDVLDLVAAVLSGGRLARLHRRLVLEEGLATSISTSNDTRVDGGAFWLYAECARGVAPEALEAAIDAELADLARRLVPARELERARRTLIASEAYENETVTDLAEELGEFAVDADWRLALDGAQRLAALAPRDLRDLARDLLGPERRVVGWSVPLDAPAPGGAPPRPIQAAKAAKAAKSAAAARRRSAR